MKPSRVHDVLVKMLDTRWPVFVWGPPGAGKSSIVRQTAGELGLEMIDVRASLLDPTDLRGIPTVEDGVARWCPPSFLPADPNSSGLLFFDELNAAPPLVQASLYQLTLDRRVGEYVLPDGWRIAAAGNRASDAAVVYRMPSALANRFVHVDFEVDVDEWAEWATVSRLHPLVIAFLRLRRDLLLDMASTERAFATPRSWEMLSDAYKALGDSVETDEVFVGTVGEGPATEFISFRESALSEKLVLAVLQDPDGAKLPTEIGQLYALISYASNRADDARVRAGAAALLKRLPVELGVLMARDILRVAPLFATESAYLDFVQDHADAIG